jgi:predicted MPP superfamily phosphohydrolase
MSRFGLLQVLFHVPLLAFAGVLLLRARRAAGAGRASATRQALRALLWFLLAVLLGAGLGAVVFFPATGFTVLRLLAQALFGELPLLLLAAAVLLLRVTAPLLAGLAGLGGTLLLGIYVWAYHVEPHRLESPRHTLALGRGPQLSGTLRIAHLSDIQSAEPGEHERRALRTAAALRPDLVVMTGDYAQPRAGGAPREAVEQQLNVLLRQQGLQAPLGVFAVPGDVDHHWPAPLEGLGYRLLSDQAARVALPGGRTLALVGLSLATSRGRAPERLQALVDESAASDYRLVFGHRPDFARDLARMGRADLALAGHTHGGQVVLPFFGPPITKMSLPRRYAGGLHDYQGLPLHVSRGVGMERGTAPQLRFLCPPEVCLLEVAYR